MAVEFSNEATITAEPLPTPSMGPQGTWNKSSGTDTITARLNSLRGVCVMPLAPSIVPGDDQNTYLVLDDFGRFGCAWRETEPDRASFEAVVADLLDGQYSNPVRVIAFNTAEGWSRDVSGDVVRELRQLSADQGRNLPEGLMSFLERHDGTAVPLSP